MIVNPTPKTKEAYQLFHRGILAFARAEQAGVRIDVDYCQQKKEEITQTIDRLDKSIRESSFGKHWQHTNKNKINLNSHLQLAHFLYKVKKLKPLKQTDSGQGSTDDEALSALNIPELNLILKMRKLLKIRDTYIDAYLREQVNGFIHTSLNLHLVRTFRGSCDSPNLQNIPKREVEAMELCRRALLPRMGHQFLAADYSAIEVYMACVYTEDPKLIDDVLHGDMHRDMAIELYMLDSLNKRHKGEGVLRQGGKNGFVFPEFYGDYYGNCAVNLLNWAKRAYLEDGTTGIEHLAKKGLVRLSKSGEVIDFSSFTKHVQKVEDDFWNRRYRRYTQWKNKIWDFYQKHGYIDMLSGFRCQGVMNKKDVTNYPIQGTAFHCLLWTFIETDARAIEKKWDSCPVLQVHDEITLDTHPSELLIVAPEVKKIACEDIITEWKWISLPLKMEMEKAEVNQSLADKSFFEV